MIGDNLTIFPLFQTFDESVRAKLECLKFVVIKDYSHNVEIF